MIKDCHCCQCRSTVFILLPAKAVHKLTWHHHQINNVIGVSGNVHMFITWEVANLVNADEKALPSAVIAKLMQYAFTYLYQIYLRKLNPGDISENRCLRLRKI
jgi:hypothetical protein